MNADHSAHTHWHSALRLAPYLLAFVLLIAISPAFMAAPSFICEDGTVYFAYARQHSFWQTLITPQLGYLSFWANLSVAAASLAPLEYSPSICYAFSLLALAILIGVGCSQWGPLARPSSRILLILLVFLIPTGHGKLFANFTHFYWAITAAFIIASNPDTRRQKGIAIFLLIIAGLSSPSASFLLPALAFRLWLQPKSLFTRAMLASLVAIFILQAAITGFDLSAEYPEHYKVGRFHNDLAKVFIVSFYAKFLASLLGGIGFAQQIGSPLAHLLQTEVTGMIATTLGIFLALLLGFGIVRSCKRLLWPISLTMLALAFGGITLGNIMTGMSGDPSQFTLGVGELRYYYVPGVLLGLFLHELFLHELSLHQLLMHASNRQSATTNRHTRLAARLLVLWLLVSGALQYGFQYRASYQWIVHSHPWSQELQKWQKDPHYQPRPFSNCGRISL
ncbi:Hypothetical protein HDN1F_10910 [gamma proteobacterium HdN1]|nr:Hypothetical protein HDN1F_10910 [gamma proteobacterium HdN1]